MRSGIRALVLAVAAWGLGSTASLAQPLSVVIPPPADLAWRGIPADEMGGIAAQVLYPGGHAGVFLFSILTHALISNGVQEAQRKARQEAADLVLAPHAAAIGQITPAGLVQSALTRMGGNANIRLVADAAEVSEGWLLEMRPTFAVAPDHRTLLLDNAIRIRAVGAGADAPPRFENFVRVVAAPRSEEEPLQAWTADDGRALKEETAAMLAHSVDVALKLPADAGDKPARTLRYLFGGREMLERGQSLARGCSRIVLRTLRERLMSVPTRPAEGAAACDEPYHVTVE